MSGSKPPCKLPCSFRPMGALVPFRGKKLRGCFPHVAQIEKGVVAKAVLSARLVDDFCFRGSASFKQDIAFRIGQAERAHESRCARSVAEFSEISQKAFAILLIAFAPRSNRFSVACGTNTRRPSESIDLKPAVVGEAAHSARCGVGDGLDARVVRQGDAVLVGFGDLSGEILEADELHRKGRKERSHLVELVRVGRCEKDLHGCL